MKYENNFQCFVREIAPALLTELPFLSAKCSFEFSGTIDEVYADLKQQASWNEDSTEWDEIVAKCAQIENDCTLHIYGTSESWGHIDRRWTCCVEYSAEHGWWEVEEWEDCS